MSSRIAIVAASFLFTSINGARAQDERVRLAPRDSLLTIQDLSISETLEADGPDLSLSTTEESLAIPSLDWFSPSTDESSITPRESPEAVTTRSRVYQPGPQTIGSSTSLDEGIDATWIAETDQLYNGQFHQVGTDGVRHRALFIRFNLNCLPRQTNLMALYLYAFNATGTPMNVYRIMTPWNETTAKPGSTMIQYIGWVNGPSAVGYWGVNITNIYSNWQTGAWQNHGLFFFPRSSTGSYHHFRSAEYTGNQAQRPFLYYDEQVDDAAPFRMCFPLKMDEYTHTPYTAAITSAFDHSVAGLNGWNCPNDEVVTFTGEKGAAIWGTQGPLVTNCGTLYELRGEFNQDFSVNGNYVGAVGGKRYLGYDGHSGHDYRAAKWTPVHATADGIVSYVDDLNKTTIIQHNPYYATFLLHMNAGGRWPAGTFIRKGEIVGYSSNEGAGAGNYHLHMTLKVNIGGIEYRIDPYGWRGAGDDPLDSTYGFRANRNDFWERSN